MKTPVLTLLFMSGSLALFAQDTTRNDVDTVRSDTDTSSMYRSEMEQKNQTTDNRTDRNNSGTTITTTRAYSAYAPATNIPTTISTSFQKEYPNASDAQWEQSNEWWRVRYRQNGQDMTMYYDNKGQGFMVALPVLQTYVPEDVVSKVKSMYGPNIYDIMQIRGATDTAVYHVRIAENGQLRSEYINAEGNPVTDIFRTDTTGSGNDSSNPNHLNNTGAPNSNWNNNTTDSAAHQQNQTGSDSLMNNNQQHSQMHQQPDNSTAPNADNPSENDSNPDKSNSSTDSPMNTPNSSQNDRQKPRPDNKDE